MDRTRRQPAPGQMFVDLGHAQGQAVIAVRSPAAAALDGSDAAAQPLEELGIRRHRCCVPFSLNVLILF